MVIRHEFTTVIHEALDGSFPNAGEDVFENSELIQYLNIKTRSASRGSKARGAFGNHYALYVLVEDYIIRVFKEGVDYASYGGARFSDLLRRQRELPFGSKLQNHSLNHRLNQEFRRYFPLSENTPILRDTANGRYWINENLLNVRVGHRQYNIAEAVIQIIDSYIIAKQNAFEGFIAQCERLQDIQGRRPGEALMFIEELLKPNVDARIFEVVSYAILKAYYGSQLMYWGWSRNEIREDSLVLYKTGRTNANDGGIDFVMRPLGRFFQVTESTDVRKYFLDIDKVQRFPITFVVKSSAPIEQIERRIYEQAQRSYPVTAVVNRYMACIEELVNIPVLLDRLAQAVESGKLSEIIDELIIQSRLEFNLPAEES